MILSLLRVLTKSRKNVHHWSPAIAIPDGECAAALGIYQRG